MRNLARWQRFATTALLCLSVSLQVKANDNPPTPTAKNFYDAYLSGKDVSGFRQAAKQHADNILLPARSTAPATLEAAFARFLPALSRALNDGSSAVALLQGSYQRLKAEHLLFLAHLDEVQKQIGQSGSGGSISARGAGFADAYKAVTAPFFKHLDNFYTNYAKIGSSNSSVAGNLKAMLGNLLDSHELQNEAAKLGALMQRPNEPILRADDLPYDTLNLAATTPVTQPVVTPSYAKSTEAAPVAADLQASSQAPLSAQVLALATKLNHDPVAIYNYVHDNIRTQWYAGAMKGADETLAQGAGNDVDQAALLIALLRASSIPAHFVHGVVEEPVKHLEQELGIDNPQGVMTAVRRAGVPVQSVIRGGRIDALQVTHTWVAAYVPYTNYRGATVDRSGKIWLPLDASYKDYQRTASTGVLAHFKDQLNGWIQDYYTSVQSQDPLGMVKQHVEQYLAAQNQTYAAQLGSNSIVAGGLHYLPNSLATPVVAVTGEEAALSDNWLQRIRIRIFQTTDPTSQVLLDTTVPVSELARKRVTLSYMPATSDDQNVVDSYGGLDSVPPYLVKLRPQIKVGGQPLIVGQHSVAMADWQRLELTVETPAHQETVSKTVLAGGYEAIGVGAQQILQTQDETRIGDTEQMGARLLSQAALRYIRDWDKSERELAQLAGQAIVRPLPTVVFVGDQLKVNRVLGKPQLINWKGVSIDAALRVTEAVPEHTGSLPSSVFRMLSGLEGSYQEHKRFEDDFFVDSISADKGLAIATSEGVPVLDLSGPSTDKLSSLNQPQAVIDDIKHWLAIGDDVRVPSGPISYQQWEGSVWVVTNPNTGAQGYFISGGLAGGMTAATNFSGWLLYALENEYSVPPVTNPQSVAELQKLGVTDDQVGTAGTQGTPLAVRAITSSGVPVKGVPVTFVRELGGVTFAGANSITVPTNALGIASAPFTHGTDTSLSSTYLLLKPTNTYSDRVSVSTVQATVNGTSLIAGEPFRIITGPGKFAKLDLTLTSPSHVPGAWANDAIAKAQDQYGNPISNVKVTFSAGTPSPQLQTATNVTPLNARVFDNSTSTGTCPDVPTVWNCGSASLTEETAAQYGATAGLINGNQSSVSQPQLYFWNVSAGQINKSISNKVTGAGGVQVQSVQMVDASGNVSAAAKVGELLQTRIHFSMTRLGEQHVWNDSQNNPAYYQYDELPVDFSGTPVFNVRESVNGTYGEAVDFQKDSPGHYSYRVIPGSQPGLYFVNVSGAVTGGGSQQSVNSDVGQVYGLLPQVTGATTKLAQQVLNEVVIGADNRTVAPAILDASIAPPSYPNQARQVAIQQDGTNLFTALKTKDGHFVIPSGTLFDTSKANTAQLEVSSADSKVIKSDPFPLPIFQPTIAAPADNQVITAYRQVDLTNQWVCDATNRFVFALNHKANVTITLSGPLLATDITLANNQTFAKGEHDIDLPMNKFEPGPYSYHMTTVSSLDGHQETRDGKLEVIVDRQDNLPVGHALDHGVDLFDGHLNLSETDFSVDGRGPTLALTRYYSSANTRGSAFGPGWSFNLNSYVADSGCGAITVYGGAGSGRYFPTANGYRPQKGLHGSLAKSSDGQGWVFTAKDGTEYHYTKFRFDKATTWHLNYIEDPNGNVLSLGYDPAADKPELSVVKDQGGRALHFTYKQMPGFYPNESANQISQVTTPGGMTLSYGYDGYGRLTSVTKTGQNGTSTTEKYSYSTTPNWITTSPDLIPTYTAIKTVTDPNGNSLDYAYAVNPMFIQGSLSNSFIKTAFVKTITRDQKAPAAPLVTQFNYSDRTDLSVPLTTTVASGKDPTQSAGTETTTYTLNDYGAPTKTVGPTGTTTTTWLSNDILVASHTDERGIVTSYQYDPYGNITEKKVGDLPPLKYTYADLSPSKIRDRKQTQTGRNGKTTTYHYDSHGNLTRIDYPSVPNGAVDASKQGTVNYHAYFTYATNGDLLTHTDRNGNVTSYTYDGYGNVTQVRTPEYCCETAQWNAFGEKTQSTNGRKATTRYQYDDLGRLVKVTDALGYTRRYTYDANGNKLSAVDEAGRKTTWTYNERDEVTETDKVTAGVTQEKEYDVFGNLVRVSDWLSSTNKHWTRYQYDLANRRTDSYKPDGQGHERHVHTTYDGVGNVIRIDRDLGRFQRFEYDALNRRTKTYDALNELAKETVYDDAGMKRTVYDKLRRYRVIHFDALGRAIKMQDYDPNGTLLRQSLKTYDGNGNVLIAVDPRGTRTVTDYDGLDRKTRVQFFEPATATPPPGGIVEPDTSLAPKAGQRLTEHRYTYDNAGNVVEEINSRLVATDRTFDLLNRMTEQEFPKGSGAIYKYQYDKVGNRIQTTWPNGNVVQSQYDALDRLTSRKDTLGTLTQRTYDGNGNLLTQTDANGNVTTYSYDGLNQVLSKQLPAQREVDYQYDLLGNRTQTTYKRLGTAAANDSTPSPSTTQDGYDVLNRKVKETDANGNVTTYAYDKVGNRTQVTDPLGHVTKYTYNALNQRIQTTDALGQVSTAAYDRVGNVIQKIDPKGNVTTYRYDGLNRQIAKAHGPQGGLITVMQQAFDGEGNVVTQLDAKGNSTVTVYDDANRPVVISQPESAVTHDQYDLMGHKVQETDPESHVSHWTYDLRGRTTSRTNPDDQTTHFAYDGNGNRTQRTEPKGQSWTYHYDGADRLTGVTDPAGHDTTYTYDYLDDRLSQTDALGHTTVFGYDALGQQVSTLYPDGDQASTTYDANGNVQQHVDPNGTTVDYSYDALDRETARTFTPATTQPDDLTGITTGYDANGNVTQRTETYRDGTTYATTQAFDAFDRLVRRTDGYGKQTQYQYDANGNRTVLTDPDQNVTRYAFDGLNRVSTVTNTRGVTQYHYDHASRLLEVDTPDGSQAQYQYDPAGRTIAIDHLQNSAQVAHYAYQYDANGNRIQQDETNGQGPATTTYSYDNLDRLTQVSYPDVPKGSGRTVVYSYDADYNRIGETDVNAGGTTVKDLSEHYNSRNQLAQITNNLDASKNSVYGYDANGNQISRTQGSVTTHYRFSVRNRLLSVTQGTSTPEAQFRYDAQGRRIQKIGARGTVRSSYDQQAVLTQFDDKGNTLASYSYGADHLLSLNQYNEGLQFYHYDALGSPVVLTKPDGTVQARYDYDAWGQVRYQSGSSWNRFGFTGHERDTETGLIYAKARYYDPATGRFLSEDTWAGKINTAPSLNKYLYGYANPTGYVDLNGHDPIDTAQRMLQDAVNLFAAGDISLADRFELAKKHPQLYARLRAQAHKGGLFDHRTIQKSYQVDLRHFSITKRYGLSDTVGNQLKVAASLGLLPAGKVIGDSFGALAVKNGNYSKTQKDRADATLGDTAFLLIQLGVIHKAAGLAETPKVTVESPSRIGAVPANADAEAGMPYEHPVKNQSSGAQNASDKAGQVPNKQLLPGEGQVAPYKVLQSAGTKGDNITPHHVPSANHMAQYGVSKGDGISINMEQPSPGVGGRHRQTFTYGTKADINMKSRDALAAGVRDARRIYQKDGLYSTYVRQQLQELIQQNKIAHSTIFEKAK